MNSNYEPPRGADADTSMPAERWRGALLPVDADLRRAIRNLDETGLQIILAVAGDGTLLGTLTDGDIRRGLLRGLDMGSPIESIIHRDPLVIPPQINRDTVLQLMRVNKIHQLQVVDADRHVVGLHLWNEL